MCEVASGGGASSGGERRVQSEDPINQPTYISPIGPDGSEVTIKTGDVLTEEQGRKLAALSGGKLKFDGHTLKSDSGYSISVGDTWTSGDIHELHHTVPGAGGAGNEMNPSGIPQSISAVVGMPEPVHH